MTAGPVPLVPPRLVPFAFAALLFVFVLGAVGFEVFCTVLLVPPPASVTIGAAAVCSLPALGIALARRSTPYLAGWVLAWAAVLLFLLAPWHLRREFVDDIRSIQPGMTVDEVVAHMGRYESRGDATWTGPCPYGRNAGGPGDRMLTWAWNSSDGRYNADIGAVTFAGGRVVDVEFLPD